MLFPVREQDLFKCRYNSTYGDRIHPVSKVKSKHRGIDIAMPAGTPVIASEDGVVLHSKNNPGGYGYYLVINHNGRYMLYAHLKELSKFKVGQKVKQGEVVAYSGNTGNSTGPHLHFEVHENNFLFVGQITNKDSAVDPVKYYPTLKDFYDKYLTDFNIKKGADIVEFKEKWQEELLIKTIETFKAKGVLNNADFWLKKAKDKTLTESELGLLALVTADRD